jgi:DNA-binding MarR family transcriptional regulator
MSSDDLYTRFDSVFIEKTRLSMMTILYREGRASFNLMKKLLGGTDGAIYTHMKKLLEAGYVEQKKEIAGGSAQTVYSLTKEGKRLFQSYLRFLEVLLAESKRG